MVQHLPTTTLQGEQMNQPIPGAEPWSAAGGPLGVLVLHGFTGNPQSMRSLAEAFAAAGYTVELPLLPGHGTRLQDMVPTRWSDWSVGAESAYNALAARCEHVVVAGLSMGGTLTVWLATRHPEIAGIVCVNPLIDGHAPVVSATVETARASSEKVFPAIGSDIALEGVVEDAYPGTPVQALISLVDATRDLQPDLAEVRCPVLILTSVEDHVVETVSSDLLAASVSGPVSRVSLERSFHVATLDHDAELIQQRAVDFVRHLSGAV